jgi:hypothetical protein
MIHAIIRELRRRVIVFWAFVEAHDVGNANLQRSRVEGVGLRVQELGFRDEGLGFGDAD